MSEVLDIEVDGEVDRPDDSGPGSRSAIWGLPVAIALVGTLLLAVLVLVVLPAVTGGDATRTAPSPGGAAPPASTAEAAPTTVAVDPRIVAVQNALTAWGEFVADGDPERLKPWFAEDGPQYRQLAEEAPELAARPGTSYSVTTEDESVTAAAGEEEAVVESHVTWTQPAEAAQEYKWDVVLRRAEDGRWLLWTIRPLDT